MSEYKQYRRKQIAELADWEPGFDMAGVSISDADKAAGSPKPGDKIARNPANHADRWLVAADYFSANFERHRDSPLQRDGQKLTAQTAGETPRKWRREYGPYDVQGCWRCGAPEGEPIHYLGCSRKESGDVKNDYSRPLEWWERELSQALSDIEALRRQVETGQNEYDALNVLCGERFDEIAELQSKLSQAVKDKREAIAQLVLSRMGPIETYNPEYRIYLTLYQAIRAR